MIKSILSKSLIIAQSDMNEQTIRWGIIGTGRIARAFAEGLKFTNNGKLVG